MKKKFLGILLSLCLVVSLVPAAVFADDSLRGDLNGDGKVDTKDVDLLQQYLEGDADLNDMQKKVADMDDNDVIDISFNMDIRVIYANTKVREDIGCAALQRGPVVYAFEGVDNDDDVQSLMIDVSRLNEAQIETEAEGILKGAVLLDIPAVRLESSDALYSEKPPRQKSVIARAIPYYMWGNRGLNQMRVWMHTIYN